MARPRKLSNKLESNLMHLRRSCSCCFQAWCWLVVAPFFAHAADEPKVAERWALLIGVDDYANANDLNYCGADQRSLRDRLRASGFPEKQIFLMHDKAEENRYRPSQRNIEKQLDVVLSLAGENDLLIVAFSGHGVSLDGKSYLCPNDATLQDPATLVALDSLYERLRDCSAKLKLVLVDACRNDPRVGGARSMTPTEETKALARNLKDLRLPEGVVLLNSCAPGEISREDEKFGHGVFMNFILEGLGGAADKDGDGALSLYELQSYASIKTRVYVADRFNDSQRPFYKIEGEAASMEFALLPTGPISNEKRWTNTVGLEFALIPPGEFQMGAVDDDPDADDDELRHKVRITKPFYLGIHEVTHAQFSQFVKADNYKTQAETDGAGGWGYDEATDTLSGPKPQYDWRNTGWPQTDEHPVVNVTWRDAKAFCDWLCRKEGKNYRLPTEAQWEYACRAGAATKYFHGDDPERLAEFANTADAAFKTKKPSGHAYGIDADDGFVFTAPVGRRKPNAFGLYDMTGNVWEWCDDWYDPQFYSRSPENDPFGPVEGTLGVYRGGSWFSRPAYARPSNRGGDSLEYRDDSLGFRLVLAP
ncbi:MAG: SUMF1/EgtB/PvdO family nonheme iron enzyme [Planctomycetia bacterium]|nr:SUMF1/EgtB/PvdO family nonheme iron enzyme [Planctomycetia bacterium]